jgi:hypothetical protein
MRHDIGVETAICTLYISALILLIIILQAWAIIKNVALSYMAQIRMNSYACFKRFSENTCSTSSRQYIYLFITTCILGLRYGMVPDYLISPVLPQQTQGCLEPLSVEAVKSAIQDPPCRSTIICSIL